MEIPRIFSFVTFFIASQVAVPASLAQWAYPTSGTPGGDVYHPEAFMEHYPPSPTQQQQNFPMNQLPPVVYPAGSVGTDLQPSQFAPNPNFGNNPASFPPGLAYSPNTPLGSLSPYPSPSKSISGDYCLEPLMSCDTPNTLLHCVKGRCTCPNQWTLAPLHTPLNTVWHPDLHRCVSTIGSGCQLAPSSRSLIIPPPVIPSMGSTPSSSLYYSESPGATVTKEIASTLLKGLIGLPSTPVRHPSHRTVPFVYCQPGIKCRHSGRTETGICSASTFHVNHIILLFTTFLSAYLHEM